MSFNQFKSKNSEFWKWVLWLGISAFTIVVGWSINHMTPTLWPIALAMCLGGGAVSFVYAVYVTHTAGSLRRKAWICEGFIIAGLTANVIIHAAISRRFDVATQARQARHLEEERDQQRKEADLKRRKEEQASEMELLAQKAEMLEKQRRLTEAQNRQLDRLPVRQRRQLAPASTPAPEVQLLATSEGAPSPTPILKTLEQVQAAAVVVLSPEQVQEQAWWWVLIGIMAEVGLIGGTGIYFIRGLIGDTNKNGVADWKEEMDPEELLAKYPDDYRRLYGGQSKQSPGMAPAPSPAYAQTHPTGKK
jgi:hypothetical protein